MNRVRFHSIHFTSSMKRERVWSVSVFCNRPTETTEPSAIPANAWASKLMWLIQSDESSQRTPIDLKVAVSCKVSSHYLAEWVELSVVESSSLDIPEKHLPTNPDRGSNMTSFQWTKYNPTQPDQRSCHRFRNPVSGLHELVLRLDSSPTPQTISMQP